MTELIWKPLLFSALAALAFFPLEQLLPAHTSRAARGAAGLDTDVWFASLGQLLTRALVIIGLGSALSVIDVVALDRALWSSIASPGLRGSLQLATALLVFEL